MSATKSCKVATVRFGTVSIREYEVIPSDNPSVQSGVGIQLGWRYNQPLVHKLVEEYEKEHCRRFGREIYHLHPPSATMRYIKLREFGFTDDDISAASLSATRQREERDKSLARMRFDRYDALKEDVRLAYKSLSKWKARMKPS